MKNPPLIVHASGMSAGTEDDPKRQTANHERDGQGVLMPSTANSRKAGEVAGRTKRFASGAQAEYRCSCGAFIHPVLTADKAEFQRLMRPGRTVEGLSQTWKPGTALLA